MFIYAEPVWWKLSYIQEHRIQFGALSGLQKELNDVECCVAFYGLKNLERT